MEEFIIQAKNLVIRDVEILNRIKKENIMYLHFHVHKEKNGMLCIVAKHPDKSDMIVSSWHHKITARCDYALMRKPKFLNNYEGKKIRYYVERLSPENNELFRMQLIDFVIKEIKILTRNLAIKNDPYFSKGGEFVVPKSYINKTLKHDLVRMKLSFNRTTLAVLSDGYLMFFLIPAHQQDLGRGKNLFGLRKFSNGLRTKKLNVFINFLKDNNKKITNYQYVITMPHENCPYGIIVFKEKK